jgi:hypothetical protein
MHGIAVTTVPWLSFLEKLVEYCFRLLGWPHNVPPPGRNFSLKNLATLYLDILANYVSDGTLKTENWTDGLFSPVLFT